MRRPFQIGAKQQLFCARSFRIGRALAGLVHALLRLGQTFPGLGRALAGLVHALLRLGQTFPGLGRALAGLGRALAELGRALAELGLGSRSCWA